MNHPAASAAMPSPEQAWASCLRAGKPELLEPATLWRALEHAVAIGATRNTASPLDHGDQAHITAVRLYIALQLRLRREGPGTLAAIAAQARERLLAALPSWWGVTLGDLLKPGVPSPVPVEEATATSADGPGLAHA